MLATAQRGDDLLLRLRHINRDDIDARGHDLGNRHLVKREALRGPSPGATARRHAPCAALCARPWRSRVAVSQSNGRKTGAAASAARSASGTSSGASAARSRGARSPTAHTRAVTSTMRSNALPGWYAHQPTDVAATAAAMMRSVMCMTRSVRAGESSSSPGSRANARAPSSAFALPRQRHDGGAEHHQARQRGKPSKELRHATCLTYRSCSRHIGEVVREAPWPDDPNQARARCRARAVAPTRCGAARPGRAPAGPQLSGRRRRPRPLNRQVAASRRRSRRSADRGAETGR